MKKILSCLVVILIYIILANPILAKAHQNLLIVGYDECAIKNNADNEEESWYYLFEENYYHSSAENKVYHHLSNDVYTIKYYFETYDYENTGYSWTDGISLITAEEIRNSFVSSMKKWNNVYYYTYDSNGNRIANRVINIIEGTVEDHNLTIYPMRNDSLNNAKTFLIDTGEHQNTGIPNVYHIHNNEWRISINYTMFYENPTTIHKGVEGIYVARESTGAHEVGHILGLDDIDVCCMNLNDANNIHHQEVLMGYPEMNNMTGRALLPTYKDIAGVSITRGFHNDDDHVWMKRINIDNTIDLICSQCNGVLYNVTMDAGGDTYQGKKVNIYKDCIHHSQTSINCEMLLVATNGEQNFYKCQNCRHIASVNINNDYYLENSNSVISIQESLGVGDEEYYKIEVLNNNIYNFNVSGLDIIDFKMFDNNFNEISTNDLDDLNNKVYVSNLLRAGIYYIQIKNEGINAQSLALQITANNQITIYNGETNILNNQNYNICSFKYTNNELGFSKISLSATSLDDNFTFPENAITVYYSSNRNDSMKRLETPLYNLDASTGENVNNLVVYLNEGQTYYIDVNMSNNNLESLKIEIESVEYYEDIDVLSNEIYNIMIDETQIGDNIQKFAILEDAFLSINYNYNGYQEETIYFVMFKEFYNINTGKFEIELVFPAIMVNCGDSFIWDSNISSGMYYIGYFNKINQTSTISITIE